ncbi:glyoxalase [bacterium]|nr:MAG: glyoxalase [bacterium]
MRTTISRRTRSRRSTGTSSPAPPNSATSRRSSSRPAPPPRSRTFRREAATAEPPAVEILGLDHASLTVPFGRESEVVPFYGGVLGLAEIDLPASVAGRGIHWFAIGPHQLHVIPEPEVAPSVRHPALSVSDVAPFRARLTAAGTTILEEPDLPGCERFAFLDPFGNKVEIIRREC